MSKIQQLCPTPGGAATPADDSPDGRLDYAAVGPSPAPRPIAALASPAVRMHKDGLSAEAEWLAGVAADALELLYDHDAAGTYDALLLLRETGADDGQPRPVAAALDGYSQLVAGVLHYVAPVGTELSSDLACKVLRIARACWRRAGSDGLPRRFPLLLAAHEGYLRELLQAFDHHRFNAELYAGYEVSKEALVRSGLMGYRLPTHVSFAVLAACCLRAFDSRRCAFTQAIEARHEQVFAEDVDHVEWPVLRMRLMALANRPTPSGMGEFSSDQQAPVEIFCEEAQRDVNDAEAWLERAQHEAANTADRATEVAAVEAKAEEELAQAVTVAAKQAVAHDRSKQRKVAGAVSAEKRGSKLRLSKDKVVGLFLWLSGLAKRKGVELSTEDFGLKLGRLIDDNRIKLERPLPSDNQVIDVWLKPAEFKSRQGKFVALHGLPSGDADHAFAAAELARIRAAFPEEKWATGLTADELLEEWQKRVP